MSPDRPAIFRLAHRAGDPLVGVQIAAALAFVEELWAQRGYGPLFVCLPGVIFDDVTRLAARLLNQSRGVSIFPSPPSRPDDHVYTLTLQPVPVPR